MALLVKGGIYSESLLGLNCLSAFRFSGTGEGSVGLHPHAPPVSIAFRLLGLVALSSGGESGAGAPWVSIAFRLLGLVARGGGGLSSRPLGVSIAFRLLGLVAHRPDDKTKPKKKCLNCLSAFRFSGTRVPGWKFPHGRVLSQLPFGF